MGLRGHDSPSPGQLETGRPGTHRDARPTNPHPEGGTSRKKGVCFPATVQSHLLLALPDTFLFTRISAQTEMAGRSKRSPCVALHELLRFAEPWCPPEKWAQGPPTPLGCEGDGECA